MTSASLRSRPLDGVRGVAIALVVITHVVGVDGAGMVGVLIFFVLSGYLITWLLVTEHDALGRVDLRAFYIRRGLRLLPALVVFLALFALTALVPPFGVSGPDVLRGVVLGLTYLTDFALGGFQRGYAPETAHLWTLAVEEHFYLLWPVILIAVLRLTGARKRLDRMTLLVAIAIVLRLATMAVSGRFNLFFYALPTTWVDSLLVGAFLALLRRDAPALTGRLRGIATRPLVLLAAIAVILGFAFTPGSYTWVGTYVLGIPFLNAAVATVILALGMQGASTTSSREASRTVDALVAGLGSAPAVALGGISYALYLYNSTCIMLAQRALGDGIWQRVGALVVAIALAAASRRLVELPFLRLKASLGQPRPRVKQP